jgi:hypothetical protein
MSSNVMVLKNLLVRSPFMFPASAAGSADIVSVGITSLDKSETGRPTRLAAVVMIGSEKPQGLASPWATSSLRHDSG